MHNSKYYHQPGSSAMAISSKIFDRFSDEEQERMFNLGYRPFELPMHDTDDDNYDPYAEMRGDNRDFVY